MRTPNRIGRTRRAAASFAAALVLAGAAPAPPSFESHWQDGRAELAGYRYEVTRYGERRPGTAVLITVTEPFRETTKVKADDPRANPRDVFEALKVNLVRDFQTGIYDYNTMVSVFSRSRDFSPAKISFSSAEWCGHVYEDLLFERDGVRTTRRSYFEGESGARTIAWRKGGVPEDLLFILLRDLRGPFLKPGETRSFPLLPSSFHTRLTHRPLEWTSATATRAASPERLRVPAGSFEAILTTVRVADGRVGRFWTDRAYPHRVLKWAWTRPDRSGRQARGGAEGLDEGVLLGSSRLAYWELHGNGDERHLQALGIGR